ncbi:MAG TPA: gephyrin-like molybdotransferase Glp [Candidatus Acidoferrales bacterium]|nr:gephyrin-like molybdotransferase Glp [Candidatus Acidoferrales bacterium]
MISYREARQIVAEVAGACVRAVPRARETVALAEALGSVLAEPLRADRDAPPFDRSTRDGFAVRSADVGQTPRNLTLVGEVRAGGEFAGTVGAGQCVQIMTGAALPKGADAVVMIEHTQANGVQIEVQRAVAAGANVVVRGRETKAGTEVLRAGTRLGFAEVSIAAEFGHAQVAVYARPRVSILSTGDEVVPVGQTPGPFQIRNSNSHSLAAQVTQAGGIPVPLGAVADDSEKLRAKVLDGLGADALVLSGGVSMGKYDLVEGVLRELGAEFKFDAVAIRPGKPAVFGVCRGKPVLGLPGNPVSTMVTFELFGVPLVDILSGAPPRALPLVKARLRSPIRLKAALAHFLPGELTWSDDGTYVAELAWQGSGDVATLARANCFLVIPETKLEFAAGDWVDLLPRRDRI